jgi:hypothetical protein
MPILIICLVSSSSKGDPTKIHLLPDADVAKMAERGGAYQGICATGHRHAE